MYTLGQRNLLLLGKDKRSVMFGTVLDPFSVGSVCIT